NAPTRAASVAPSAAGSVSIKPGFGYAVDTDHADKFPGAEFAKAPQEVIQRSRRVAPGAPARRWLSGPRTIPLARFHRVRVTAAATSRPAGHTIPGRTGRWVPHRWSA